MTGDTALARRLAARTLELVDIPSVSRDEEPIARHVAAALPSRSFAPAFRDGGTLLSTTPRAPGRPLVVLAGHLDTVPAQDNLPGRIEGDAVVGLGASDMKGGLAVMLELARWLDEAAPERDLDLGLLFFGREELPASESPLPRLFERSPVIGQAELVVMLEPTDNTVQAGCLGNLNARLSFAGESAHSARPWLGVNAIELAVEGLLPLVRLPPHEVTIGGLAFAEVLSVTGIAGGIAQNVIPDRVACELNFRYAPSRSPAEAEERLRSLVESGGTLEVLSNSPPARVVADTPLVERLRRAGGFAVEPKQAWTAVAEFTSRGLDAVNLGPGATRYAHRRDERVAITELVRTFRALQRFLAATV